MTVITLEPTNRDAIQARLTADTWAVACLCAAWCDVCQEFRERFAEIAAKHPDKLMLWIDVEDEADIVGDFEVENFPTLLIQRGNRVAFYGPIEPDAGSTDRLIKAQTRDSGLERPVAAHDRAHDLQLRLAAARGSGG